MNNLQQKLGVGAAIFMAVLMVLSVAVGPAAADGTTQGDFDTSNKITPAPIPADETDVTQKLTTEADDMNIIANDNDDISLRIDISDLPDGVLTDSSAVSVDTGSIVGADNVNFAQLDAEDEIAYVSVKADSNVDSTDGGTADDGGDLSSMNFDDGAIELTGLNTEGIPTQSNLEYVVRVDVLTDPQSSNFETEGLQTSDTFDVAQVEVENLDTGEQISTTSVTDAISEANDPTSNDLGGGSVGDQVEIRPGAGTYVFDGQTITDDNTRIVPLDGADVTFQNDDGDDTLTVGASNVEIDNITFDQDTNAADAVSINDATDSTVINASTFTGVQDANNQDVVDVSDGAGAVTIDNSEFVGDGVAATAINAGPNDNGDDDLDLTVTNTNITGFDDPDGTNGEGIILANAISSATIENNNFDKNDQHVDDEAGVTGLNTVFDNNDFAELYVTIEDTNGDIQEAIYGDLDTAEAVNSEIDAAASGGTVTIAGQHTVTSAIDLANNGNDGLTVTAAGSGATIVSDNDPVFVLSSGAKNIEVSGITFDLSNGVHGAIDDTANNFAGLSVTDNTFNGANGGVVVVDLGQGTYDDGLTVNNNTFDSSNNYQAISVNGAGLSGTTTFEINENSINDADGSDAIALGILGSSDIELSIQNNEITNQTNNDALSIDPDNADTVTIADNTLTGENDGAGTGLSIVDAGDNAAGSAVSVSNNQISDFDNEGGSGTAVSTEAADVSFSGNSLADNAVQFSDDNDNYDEQSIIDNNNISPVVLGLDQRGGDIQDNAVYGTVEAGVEAAEAANADRFVDVGEGTYEENSITIDSLGGSLTVDGSDAATLTTDTANQIVDINVPGGAVTISNMTFAPSADNANPDIDITDTSAHALTIENNVFSGPGADSRQAVLIDSISNTNTVTISDNEFSDYAEAVEYDDGGAADVTLDVVRNAFNSNTVAVDLTSSDGGADNNDVFRIHFNDIAGNEDGVIDSLTSGDLDTLSLRGNWWGDASGPSGDFTGDGDTVTDGSGDVVLSPWLTDSVDTLPTDRYVVINDPVAPISDDTDTAEVLVAALDDGLAQGEDQASTVLLGDPAGPITINENPGSVSAANPVLYTITSTDSGDYELTAANTDDNINSGSATQSFTGQASGLNVTVDSDTLVADDDSTINATATLVDDNGNAVDRGGSYGITYLIQGSNDAGVTQVTNEDLDTTTPDSQARLEISAANADVDLTIIASADTGGYSGSATVSTVEPSQANFTLDLVEGPTTITQNESYSATVNVTNIGDSAGTQDITYNLEDSTGISQLSATEEDVQLDAGASQEVTFEVAAADTQSLSTGDDYAHVFESNDDTLTIEGVSVNEAGTASASVTFNDQSVQNGTEEVTVDSANFTRADGSAGDYVVVVHVVNDTEFDIGVDNSISAPVGASGNLSNGAESITVDLNSSAAFEDGDALDTLSENVTLRAMLHTTANDSAFDNRLGNAIAGIEPGDETDDANITVEEAAEDAPANFEVSNVTPDGVNVTAGDNITVNADIENVGGQQATQSVEFRIVATDGNTSIDNASATRSQNVTLNASANDTVTFENVSTDGLTAGDFTHGVFSENDSATATITVEEDAENVTVGDQEVPVRFTTETENGDRTVTADNAVDAINTFLDDGISADVAVDVINAFLES